MKGNVVYIITNFNRTVLYIGVTSNLELRLAEHRQGIDKGISSFTARYRVCYLIYFEHFGHISDAILREKQLKKWTRAKKEALIARVNPNWIFLNV